MTVHEYVEWVWAVIITGVAVAFWGGVLAVLLAIWGGRRG